MANILYVYKDQVYANITNKCDCACTFCIRSQQDGVGDAETLWHKVDPTLEDIYAQLMPLTSADTMNLFSADTASDLLIRSLTCQRQICKGEKRDCRSA